MNHETFQLIAQTARELRTEAATYTLLEAYASSGCATYPVDSALFLELWPDGQVPGYVLTTALWEGMNTHTVAYAEVDDASDAHTPGPWMVTPDHDAIDKARAEGREPHVLHDNRFVSSVDGDLVCSLRDQPTQRADARLIAAAPDLLAALKNMVGAYGGEPMSAEGSLDAYENAKAVIAKAEGGAA